MYTELLIILLAACSWTMNSLSHTIHVLFTFSNMLEYIDSDYFWHVPFFKSLLCLYIYSSSYQMIYISPYVSNNIYMYISMSLWLTVNYRRRFLPYVSEKQNNIFKEIYLVFFLLWYLILRLFTLGYESVLYKFKIRTQG